MTAQYFLNARKAKLVCTRKPKLTFDGRGNVTKPEANVKFTIVFATAQI